jgi:hypothetical protein
MLNYQRVNPSFVGSNSTSSLIKSHLLFAQQVEQQLQLFHTPGDVRATCPLKNNNSRWEAAWVHFIGI